MRGRCQVGVGRYTVVAVLSVVIAAGLLSPGRRASGTEVKLTNRLATATSPYLREAAGQPVAWYPWGEEPFRLATALDRPILLDIGAIWCHWCHVMDQETYSNLEIARLINHAFIAIKVDRDERPDIDIRYQQAVQVLTGSGGWPLTVFLTPAGQVFYGGSTFFPEDRFGRPGFKTLLPKIAEVYHRRKEAVLEAAAQLQAAVTALETEALRHATLSPRLVQAIAQAVLNSFDALHGGFGQGAKFPMGSPIALALRLYAEQGDEELLRIAAKTLDAIANGGIHDQVGGGFHRFATDPAWQIPHFEKMDYVNAQLLESYLLAYQATGEMRYREVAEGIITYVNGVLSDQERGGFYAHQDADMGPGDDGAYYTWAVQEVQRALSKEEAAVMLRYYGVTEQGNMESTPGRNVLWVATTSETIARDLPLPLSTVESLIARGKAHLLEVRHQRKTPLVDRTLYADRNGMMISAYLEAYQVLGREELKDFGLKSLEFLLAHLRAEDGGLYHAFAEDAAHVPGFLDDYVWVAEALLQAFQVTGEARYLATARDLMDRALRTFWDACGSGFFDLRPDPAAVGPLKRPAKAIQDTSTPAPNTMAALVLDQLALLTNVQSYQQKAQQLLEAFAGRAPEYGWFAASYALAVDLHLHPPAHAVIVGRQADARTRALWRAALGAFRPGKLVAVYDPAVVKPAELPPPVAAAIQAAQTTQAGPQAYVCVGITCSLPTTEPAEVATLVATFQREGPQEGVRETKAEPGQTVPTLGNQHIASPDTPHQPYNTRPPTSGLHLESLARWGIHSQPIPDELQVHNLEDGGVLVQYRCRDCDELVAKLRAIVSRYPDRVILAPYPHMDTRIALTAWGRIDAFDEVDEGRIVRFIEAYRGIDHHVE